MREVRYVLAGLAVASAVGALITAPGAASGDYWRHLGDSQTNDYPAYYGHPQLGPVFAAPVEHTAGVPTAPSVPVVPTVHLAHYPTSRNPGATPAARVIRASKGSAQASQTTKATKPSSAQATAGKGHAKAHKTRH